MSSNQNEDEMPPNDVSIDSYAAYSMSANGADVHFRNILEPRILGLHNVRSISSLDAEEFAFIDPPRQIFVFFDNDEGVDVLLDMDPTSSTDGPGPVVCIRYKELRNTTKLAPPLFFFGENGSVGITYADAIDGLCHGLVNFILFL